MNSKAKYAQSRKHRQHGWPRGFHANQLKGFLGSLGCGTAQLASFEDVHGLSKAVFQVPGDDDHRITAAQISALGSKERKRRASEYVALKVPSALWPEKSRARGTLKRVTNKARESSRLSNQQRQPKFEPPADAFRWPSSLRHLHAWMVAMGVDPLVSRTQVELLELGWEIHQSAFDDVNPLVQRPTSLAGLQRRLTGQGKKFRIWERPSTPSRDYRLGTFGPASPVRSIPTSAFSSEGKQRG